MLADNFRRYLAAEREAWAIYSSVAETSGDGREIERARVEWMMRAGHLAGFCEGAREAIESALRENAP